jgi:hypothetical protein
MQQHNIHSSYTLLHHQGVTEEIREEIKKFLKFNENESTTYWNAWDTAKAVLKGKFTASNAYVKTQRDLKQMT